MNELAARMLQRVKEALPQAKVYWENDPPPAGLQGSAITAEFQDRKFTLQFESKDESSPAENGDISVVEQVVDDFVDFFERSIYKKEKFTRVI